VSTKTHSGSSHTGAIACAPGAIPGGLARTRFFDGMFLTQADLENEQRYWRMKRRLTNRALGTGIVWGLRLAWDAKQARFVLSPGYALDCCGNDLVVEGTRETTARELWERADPAVRAPDPRNPQVSRRAGVVLQYVECAEDARPVHRDACAGPTSDCETSRIRETARLVLVPPPSPLPATPIEGFVDELEQFSDGLPSKIRDRLFPRSDQSSEPVPGPQPTGAPLPLTVRVAIARTSAERTLQPLAGQTVPADSVSATHYGRHATLNFEITPHAGWGFTRGDVTDAGLVVDSVSPPLAMSMFWSLNILLPAESSPTDDSIVYNLKYVVDDLRLEQMFGARSHGAVSFQIRGLVRVQAWWQGGVEITVEDLHVVADASTITEGGDRTHCFDQLVPWGWAVDPARGGDNVKVILLSALYAFLSESATHRDLQKVAEQIYIIAWYLLFGASIVSDVPDQYRAQLAVLLRRLFERWCNGFVYPGPRCSDDHHGIYLGSVEISASGAIESFDMWQDRRHVLTGPLLTHWARLFGIAPLDVMVGRFADALCCVASGTLQVPPPDDDHPSDPQSPTDAGPRASFVHPGHATQIGPILLGPSQDIAATARRNWPDAEVRPGTWPEVIAQFVRAITSGYDDSNVRQVITATVPGGGTVGIVVPGSSTRTVTGPVLTATPTPTGVRADVLTALRRGDARATARAREPVADFVVSLANDTPLDVVGALPGAGAEAVKRFAERAITLGQLLELGPDTAFVRLWASPEESQTLRDGVDAVFDAAEGVLDRITVAAARATGAGFSRATLTEPSFHERAAAELKKEKLGVDPKLVATAARRASGQGR
jgi:hypothetical protein